MHPGASQSAIENIGPHLLGGKRMPEDPKDYDLVDYLDSHRRITQSLSKGTTLEEAYGAFGLDVWHAWYAFYHAVEDLFHGKPAPTPTPSPSPTPAPTSRSWQKLHGISDQGQTGHCVGFTGLDWGNTLVIDDAWANQVGHDIYYECKVIDGEPGQENGSDSRSLCKALKNRGRIGAYAFAGSADVAAEYVLQHGPVGIGIPWMNDMFSPDAKGLLHITGGEAGGHEIELNQYDANGFGIGKPAFWLINHWTQQWGKDGGAILLAADLDKLLGEGGDCWAGLELPLAKMQRRLDPGLKALPVSFTDRDAPTVSGTEITRPSE